MKVVRRFRSVVYVLTPLCLMLVFTIAVLAAETFVPLLRVQEDFFFPIDDNAAWFLLARCDGVYVADVASCRETTNECCDVTCFSVPVLETLFGPRKRRLLFPSDTLGFDCLTRTNQTKSILFVHAMPRFGFAIEHGDVELSSWVDLFPDTADNRSKLDRALMERKSDLTAFSILSENRASVEDPEVAKHIRELPVDAESQAKAVEWLLARGRKSVPSLILSMGDDRSLPTKRLALPNGDADCWEAFRLYSPKTADDLLSALTDHFLRLGIVSTMNGGDEADRRREREMWRQFLVRWRRTWKDGTAPRPLTTSSEEKQFLLDRGMAVVVSDPILEK